jgi:hypothetical protein
MRCVLSPSLSGEEAGQGDDDPKTHDAIVALGEADNEEEQAHGQSDLRSLCPQVVHNNTRTLVEVEPNEKKSTHSDGENQPDNHGCVSVAQ